MSQRCKGGETHVAASPAVPVLTALALRWPRLPASPGAPLPSPLPTARGFPSPAANTNTPGTTQPFI